MAKLMIPKSEVARYYVENCVLGGMSQAKLAASIGIGAARLNQILKEPAIKQQIEELQIKAAGDPTVLNTKGKVDVILSALEQQFNIAIKEGDDIKIIKYAGPMIDALRVRGLLEKVGLTVNNNINTNIINRNELIQNNIKSLTRRLVKFVPLEKQQEMIKEMDQWVNEIELEKEDNG